MKKLKYISIIASAALLTLSSCKKFLDVNENPNEPTESIPELTLQQGIVGTAAYTITGNTYGAWQVGYTSNAGGFGGFGAQLTYNYDRTSYNTLWTTAYNNLQDYEYVFQQSRGKDEYAYYEAAARIMKAFLFQRLVDEYNDIPYSQALLGTGNTAPSYDKAEDVYIDLYKQLDTAIAVINNAQHPRPFKSIIANADPLFNDDMTKWKQLANTIKLRLLVRASGTSVFSGITPTFDPVGFLTTNAIINPGYTNVAGQQNPAWEAYHSSASGVGAARSIITTHYVVTLYNGVKITDFKRAQAVYRGGINPARNQTGEQVNNPPAPSGSSVWYSGNGSTYSLTDNPDGTTPAKSAVGVLKGRNMGQPLLLAAESYFLQAEARMRGIITTGDVKTLYEKGIEASFDYLYRNSLNSLGANPLNLTNPVGDAAQYLVDNSTNRLVNIDLATNDAQRLEAIITQKYIALNMIHGNESWAEFRRTGYPTIVNTTPLQQNNTWVSTLSEATTVDKLVGRVQYPNSEFQLNSENVPKNITVFGSFVFWDRR